MKGTASDLTDNISAMAIAICYSNYLTPEEAFGILEGNRVGFKLTEEDKEDMLKLKQDGLTYREIGEMYGFSDTRAFKIIKNYRRKKETLQGGNLAKVNGTTK